MTRRAGVTQAMIERAIRAAQAAGLTVTGVRIEGAVLEILTAEEKTAKAAKPTHRPDVRL
jgi:hypothetical protein